MVISELYSGKLFFFLEKVIFLHNQNSFCIGTCPHVPGPSWQVSERLHWNREGGSQGMVIKGMCLALGETEKARDGKAPSRVPWAEAHGKVRVRGLAANPSGSRITKSLAMACLSPSFLFPQVKGPLLGPQACPTCPVQVTGELWPMQIRQEAGSGWQLDNQPWKYLSKRGTRVCQGKMHWDHFILYLGQ